MQVVKGKEIGEKKAGIRIRKWQGQGKVKGKNEGKGKKGYIY
jgi:hypothetical protein